MRITVFLLFMASIIRAQEISGFQPQTFINNTGDTLLYRFFVPKTKGKKVYPLVIFLHGSGERGNDNEKQLAHGVKNFVLPENQKRHPCFILAPQCPVEQRWVNADWRSLSIKQPENPSRVISMVMELIRATLNQFPVDPERVYITGLSMGGFGTWDLITRYPDFFAAAIPVCGGGDTSLARKIVRVPVWVFHGAKDDVVSPELSRNMIKALKNASGFPLYTEYPNQGHACWDTVYADKMVFKWLFRQTR